MPETSLNELNRTLGGLIAAVDGLRRDVQEDRRISSAYRQGVRDELTKITLQQKQLETELTSIKNKVDAHERVTVEVTTLRTKAIGAGKMGQALLWAGGWLLGAAGWVYGAYLWFMGRPPP